MKRSWSPPPPPNRPIRQASRSRVTGFSGGISTWGVFDSAVRSGAIGVAATPRTSSVRPRGPDLGRPGLTWEKIGVGVRGLGALFCGAFDGGATPDFIVSPCQRGRLFEEQDSPTSGEWVAVRSVVLWCFRCCCHSPDVSGMSLRSMPEPAGANGENRMVLRAVTRPAGANEKYLYFAHARAGRG